MQVNTIICKRCNKVITRGNGAYEIWNLSCPARCVGWICEECWDKRLFVRVVKFLKQKLEDLRGKDAD